MQNIRLTVNFLNSQGETKYAICFTGVMSKQHIYAKRAQATKFYNHINYIQVAKKDTRDTTSQWLSAWEVPHRDIYVSQSLKFKDPRISVKHNFPEFIATAIDEAIKMQDIAENATINSINK